MSEVVEVDGSILLDRANALSRRIDAIAETVFDTICVHEKTISDLQARLTEYVLEVSVLKAELRNARLAVVEAREKA